MPYPNPDPFMPTRRDFLKHSLLMGGAAMGAGAFASPRRLVAMVSPSRSLRVLILGGTGFIGPHVVHGFISRGHQVTVFNRGRSEPRLYPEIFDDVENLIGDRDGDLASLEGREWDVVVDNSGYTPDQVRATAQLLSGSVGQYIFTSTRGVYAGFTHSPMDEDAPIGMAGLPPEEWTGYGPLKAAAELEVREFFPRRHAIVRPPIITGPGDATDRFTFWYDRVDRGGEVLAPGDPSDPIQYVDVRDLTDFMVKMAEEDTDGIFNVEAPAAPLSVAEFLYGLRATTGSPVTFTWVDWDFLEEHGLRGGQEIAAWRPPTGDNLNYGRIDNTRALEAGMTFRPLAVTAMDTLSWRRRWAEGDESLRSGYSAQKEAEVIAAWRRR